jgi:hypothetical protein
MFPSVNQLSHAVIVTGNRDLNIELVKQYLSSEGFVTTANPDFYVFNAEQLLIDDAFAIIQMLTSQKVSDRRVCIIACDRVTHEVQNTLLKTIEEPHTGTHIILLVPTTDALLPTILSRAQVFQGASAEMSTRLTDYVDSFLRSAPADRFGFIEQWVKNKKEEENLTKIEVVAFITEIEKRVWETGNRDSQLFEDIERMRTYAQIRGASHRVILDFLGMICPQVKK